MSLLERDGELAAIDAVLASGGILVVEGGAGIGKTTLLDVAAERAQGRGREVLRGRGSPLETDFTFGVVRQLFEHRIVAARGPEQGGLLAGPAGVVRSFFLPDGDASASDASFAVLHGLYWLAVNMAGKRPLLLVVDDAHWADGASLRWLAYLGSRLQGLPLTVLVALRPAEAVANEPPLLAVRAEATVVRPKLLSEAAVAAIVRDRLAGRATGALCASFRQLSGGNPFYLAELLRAMAVEGDAPIDLPPGGVVAGRAAAVARHVLVRIHRLEPDGLRLAQALAVLGDGCELRHGAALAEITVDAALRLSAGLVRAEVLAGTDPPRFLHPVVREGVEASMAAGELDAAHRRTARLLHTDGAPPGRIAAHLTAVQPAGDPWVVERLREAARDALHAGAPQSAAELLDRAWAEPAPAEERVGVLRELARAEAAAGRETACSRLEAALALSTDPVTRAEIALEVAETYAGLFRWVEAVDVIERALVELGDADPALAARLEGELVVAGLHDARRASRVPAALERLAARRPAGAPAEALAVATGMAAILTGQPAAEAALPLERALADAPPLVENWDTRAALLWSLIAGERFDAVAAALEPMRAQVERSGSARGFVATYSTLGLLNLRLGALPEADAAARTALRVLQEGDFAPGLAFGATVLADVAIEAGELDEARQLVGLLPQDGWPPGVGTVLIPAVRGRLRLAEGRAAEALEDFQRCLALFGAEAWGIELRDVGYLHARAGGAQALLLLGRRKEATELAEAELADVRQFGGSRALGVATRAAGLAVAGRRGLDLLAESVAALRTSPAVLERAKSLVELGAALRRAGDRVAARPPLTEGLDLAARAGARPLSVRARDELRAAGARPRRQWRQGVEALTPSELRVVRLAAEGRTNREIAHSLYVTLKTVEGHLARAYGKLGISNRHELREVLGDEAGEKTRVGTPS